MPNEIRLPDYELIAQSDVLPLASHFNWGIANYVASEQRPNDGEGVFFAVFDEGVTQHTELSNRVTFNKSYTHDGLIGVTNHGTHVAGTLASSNPQIGLCPKAEIGNFRVLSEHGGSLDNVVRASYDLIDLSKQMDMAVICNMSLGAPIGNATIAKAIADMVANNISVFCAAGNDSGDVNYPASDKNTIAVAAIDPNENITSFSSKGKEVTVAAAGYKIWSTYGKTKYAVMTGTSMACPFASGMAGKYASRNRTKKSFYDFS